MAKQLMYSFTLPKERRNRVKVDFKKPSLTKTEFAESCEIENIIAYHKKTGSPYPKATDRYEDVSDVPSFQSALDVVSNARASFQQLDARVRRYYNDNIQSFLTALDDPEEYETLVKFGVLKEKEPVETVNKAKDAPSEPTGGGGATAPTGGSEGA